MAPTGGGAAANGQAGSEAWLTFEVELRKPAGARLGIDVMAVSTAHGCGLAIEKVAEGGVVEAWNRGNEEPLRVHPGDFIVKVNGIEGDIEGLAQQLQAVSDVHMTVQRAGAEGSCKDLPATNDPVEAGPSAVAGRKPHQSGTAFMAPPLLGHGQQMSSANGIPRWPTGRAGIGAGALGAGARTEVAAEGQGVLAPGPIPAPASAAQESQFSFEVKLQKPDGASLGIDVLPVTLRDVRGLALKQISRGGLIDTWNHAHNQGPNVCPGDCIVRVNSIMGDFMPMMEELKTGRDLTITVLRGAQMMPVHLSTPASAAPTAGGVPVPGASLARSGAEVGPSQQRVMPMQHHAAGQLTPGEERIRFSVNLEKKAGTRVGLDVMLFTGNGLYGLVIERVAEGGCIDEWNKMSQDPYRVQVGDCIVQIGDCPVETSGASTAVLAKELSPESTKVSFVVQRNPESAAHRSVRTMQSGAAAVAALSNQQAPSGGAGSLAVATSRSSLPVQVNPVSIGAGANPEAAASGRSAQGSPSQRSKESIEPPPGLEALKRSDGDVAAKDTTDLVDVKVEIDADADDQDAPHPADSLFVVDGPQVFRGRNSCSMVAPIGAARAGTPRGTPTGASDDQGALLASMLQLADEDLTILLRKQLSLRPYLRGNIADLKKGQT
eukprot:gnl/TRDRNA2_/TRDRNA2_186923_c0_seq1.p1 gnl/TRDRNA2_/TRDRNA2_186923_c0~~gnl/TRDRNA2_/TRDRNA2_186923_c0_seq1.p1  ORF type:complete len:663 (-),score=97.78 gnl/TRDRNA2_/TRDRNA2_186923_c0_seq1:14-2002(-)